MDALPCPNCELSMNALKVQPPGGRAVELDVCPSCGGIWFDRDELKQASKQRPARERREDKSGHQCPRCQLMLFEETLAGRADRAFSCGRCDGVFVTAQGITESLALHRNEDQPSLPGDETARCDSCLQAVSSVTFRSKDGWVCERCVAAEGEARRENVKSVAASVGLFVLSVLLNSDGDTFD